MPLCYDTINLDRLAKYPEHKKAPTYDYSKHMGQGCSGDPPGFPSYFLISVYTQHGNTPSRGATTVIRDPDGVYRVVYSAENTTHDALGLILRRLWKRLPLDHPRTRLWIRSTWRHLTHCYVAPPELRERENDDIFIWPIPYYKQALFRDDPRFSEEWRANEQARVAASNAELERLFAPHATPANHKATRAIQAWYPQYQPEDDPDIALFRAMEDGGKKIPHEGDWWEREAERPSLEECESRQRRDQVIGTSPHQAPRTWCQYCGWRLQEDV